MGEIDAKPFDYVQNALSLFEMRACHNMCNSSGNGEQKKKELGLLQKELANCKVQLEVYESANKQATLELEVHHRTVNDLLAQLKISDAETDKYKECQQAQTKIAQLEYEKKAMETLLLGSTDHPHGFVSIHDELKDMKEELHAMRSDVTAAEKSKTVAERRAELMEVAVSLEKEQSKKKLIRISAVNKAILSSILAAIEADKERSGSFFGMKAQLHNAKEALSHSDGKLEEMQSYLDHVMSDTENELLAKMIQVDYLKSELVQAKELSVKLSEYTSYFALMEAENKATQEEIHSERGRVSGLNCQMQSVKHELFEMKGREVEFEVEIARLKAELHQSRSRIAAAEAAEARALNVQAELRLAVQQLALEVEGNKIKDGKDATEGCNNNADESTGAKSTIEDMDSSASGKTSEFNMLKEELEAANSKMTDLRLSLEEATRRAELAERAKAAIEDQLRKWREEQQQRRVSAEALSEHSTRKDAYSGKNSSRLPPLNKSNVHSATFRGGSSSAFGRTQLSHVPLAKVLNMKF